MRACARYAPAYVDAARRGLDSLALLPIDDDILARASRVDPSSPRSLDAIHIATALSLGDDLGVLLCYDERLAQAARAARLPVTAPR